MLLLSEIIRAQHLRFFYGLFWGLTSFFTFCENVSAQLPATNIGFESGTFLNWQGSTGSCCPVYAPNQGIIPGRHTITSGTNFDSLSNNLIAQVCAGSIYSAQLGNSGGDAESEQLYYQTIIPGDSLLLLIKYAVLLQNAQHPPSKQPRFRYEVKSSGIPLYGCTEKQILAGDVSVPFLHYQDIDILPWQSTAIDLAGKAGDTLKLAFETGDCEPGGHFGYAYVDVMLVPKKVYLEGCFTDGSMSANVAPGMNGLWMNGQTTDTIMVANPDSTDEIYYLLNANTGCDLKIYAEPEKLLPSSEFTYTELCDQQVVFHSNTISGTISTLLWDFGDGSISNGVNVTYQYNLSGNYDIVLTATGLNNCSSKTLQTIIVQENPVALFSAIETCAGVPVSLDNISQHAAYYSWLVNGSPEDTTGNPINLILQEGNNTLQLIASNNLGCSDTSIQSIYIKPEFECLFPEMFLFAPNSFTPNGDGINDNYKIVNVNSNKMIEIFNRFGQLIYSGNSWNGKYNYKDCTAGIYVVRYHHKNKLHIKSILLLR